MSEKAPSQSNEQPTSSAVLDGFKERFGAENMTDDERASLSAEWNKFGGSAIDEAQKNVDALNVKSNATDHVYAKAALRDARSAFYKNYTSGTETTPTEEPTVAPEATDDLDEMGPYAQILAQSGTVEQTPSPEAPEVKTFEKQRDEILNDEDRSSWEKIVHVNELAAKIGKVAQSSIEAAGRSISPESPKVDDTEASEPAPVDTPAPTDAEPQAPEDESDAAPAPIDAHLAPGTSPEKNRDAKIDDAIDDLSVELDSPEQSSGSDTETTDEVGDSPERSVTKTRAEKWAERQAKREQKRDIKDRAKNDKKTRQAEKEQLRREKEVMDYVENIKNPKIKKNHLGKLLRTVKGLPSKTGRGLKKASLKTADALKRSISNDQYYNADLSTPDADAEYEEIAPVPVNLARGEETPEEFAARNKTDLKLASEFLAPRSTDNAAETTEPVEASKNSNEKSQEKKDVA
jgi:hypothetical protein